MICRLNPDTFADAFHVWATAALAGLSGELVCVDGKTWRGSRDRAPKNSLRQRKLRAALNDNYRLELLLGERASASEAT